MVDSLAVRRHERSAAARHGQAAYVLSPLGAARRSVAENRLLQAMASAGTGIWEWDTKGDRVSLSETLAYLFFGIGEDLQDVPLRAVMDAVAPADRARVTETLRRALARKSEYDIEFRVARSDGSERWINSRGRVEADAGGNVWRVLGTATDVTGRARTRGQLRLTEEHFRTLADHAAQIVWLTGPGGELRHIAPAFERYAGVAAGADTSARRLLATVHPADRAAVLRIWSAARRSGRPCEFDLRLRGADGSYRYFRNSGVPLLGADGAVREWFHTCTDIDALKRAQLCIARSEERFRTLVESTTQLVWTADAGGGITEISAAFRRLAGVDSEAALAARWSELVRPDYRARAVAAWQGAVAGGHNYETEFPLRVADGSYRFFKAQAAPLRHADGSVREWIGTLSDIDAQKRAEEALQASEQKLESILDSLTDVVWSVSTETRQLLYLGPAVQELTGIASERFFANPALWKTLVHPDDWALADLDHLRLRKQGSLETEFRMLRADGTVRWVQNRAKAIRDAHGRLLRFDGIVKDITAHKTQAQRLERLNRVHAVLSGINALIVRARSREQLFREACRIAVEQGQFRLAWIGEAVGGEIRPLAVAGHDDGYVEENCHISLSSHTLRRQSPVAADLRALRTRVFNDIAADPELQPWREATLRRGLRSAAVFPLAVRGGLAGCIGLYAGESGFFDEEELKLLSELAGDIAYAMESLGHRQELEYLACYDGLTGLANRRMFSERLNRLIGGARDTGEGAAVVMLDLAHFKTVNDTLGMPAGDELLKMMARRLVRLAGGRHHVARLGADRFAVAVPGVRGEADLAPLLRERPWNVLNRPYALGGQHLHVPARAGLALFPQDAADAETLIQNAETALKNAKAAGERYMLYAREMSAGLKQKLQAETRLRRAVDAQEFVLHYQPRVDLRDGSICGVEALLRWNCPERGLVPPGEFIADLEHTGLIVEAGRWVLERAAADHRRWLAQGLAAPRIAVNVSAAQLRQPDFVECLRRIACAPGAAPGLELEVTESMLMQDIEQKIAQLREVRAMGIPVAIDDFGTGYSSLSYLSRLPISTIKVDRSFVETVTSSADTMGIVSTIISLAHSMSLRVVAEGVETNEQVKFLRLLRCDEVQGFLYSKPLEEAALAALLERGAKL